VPERHLIAVTALLIYNRDLITLFILSSIALSVILKGKTKTI